MAMMAKEAFPYLVLQTVGTTITAALSPLKLHYRAQVLENLNDPEGAAFWEASKAIFNDLGYPDLVDILELIQ